MLQEFLIACCLVLILEGVLPFLSPSTQRRLLAAMLEADDRTLRVSGLVSMVIGVALLYLIH